MSAPGRSIAVEELADQARLIIDCGEPEALLATIARAASRKALDRNLTDGEAQRWQKLADRLKALESELIGIPEAVEALSQTAAASQ